MHGESLRRIARLHVGRGLDRLANAAHGFAEIVGAATGERVLAHLTTGGLHSAADARHGHRAAMYGRPRQPRVAEIELHPLGLVKLATCSHMRSIPQHDVPTSAQHVYGNLRDKWTCQARLNAFGATLSPWHDKLTFAISQQTFRRRLCFRSMCKWTPDFQALPVLPLAIIRPPCMVPWIVDRVPA